MKITKTQLKQIIKEELATILKEDDMDEKAKLFAQNIGKQVRGAGYPGATIAGKPLRNPDGIWAVPLHTSGDEPDYIGLANLEIVG